MIEEMFTQERLLLGLPILTHVLLAFWTQVVIVKSQYLNVTQKTLNSILTWSIPFIWGLIVRKLLKKANQEVMTKSKRTIKQNQNVGSNSVPGSNMA